MSAGLPLSLSADLRRKNVPGLHSKIALGGGYPSRNGRHIDRGLVAFVNS